MSYEQAVKAKHEFQRNLKEFLHYSCAMTTEEIELGMGRIADRMETSTTEVQQFHYQVKGTVLKMVLDQRTKIKLHQSNTLRTKLHAEAEKYFASLGEEQWAKEKDDYEKYSNEVQDKIVEYWNQKEQWDIESKKNFGFFTRFFSPEKLPPKPTPPPIRYIRPKGYFVEMWRDRTNIGEFLVQRITEFSLFPTDSEIPDDQSQVYDVTPEDVKLLAQQ